MAKTKKVHVVGIDDIIIIMADNGRFIKTSDPLSLMSSFYVESRKQ